MFSDFGCNFLLLEGVFSQMFKKQISKHSSKQFCLWKTPSSHFFIFPLFACLYFLKLFHLSIFGELRKVRAKNFMFLVIIDREIIFRSWQLYDLFHTQCYNFAIVHCDYAQLRKVKLMQPVWLCMLSGRRFEHSFQNAQWRKAKKNATIATMHSLRQVIWGGIWKGTLEKRQTNANIATLDPHRQVIWL